MIQLSWILVQLFAPSAFEDKVIKNWLNLFDCVDVLRQVNLLWEPTNVGKLAAISRTPE